MATADTRRRILDTARKLFNEHGVHRVGVRDVARATDMSPGNLAYHFPTKDDLVAALVMELHELEARTAFAGVDETFSLSALYRAAVVAMRNMLPYRFVLLSYVDAVLASPALRKLETTLEAKRRRRSDQMIALLVEGGFIDGRAVASRMDRLYEQGAMISSGWLWSAVLHPRGRDDEAAVLHYAKLGCALLEPYCTKKGARDMRRILNGDYDAEL